MPDLTLPDPAPALPANGNNLSLSIHPSTHGGPPKTSVDKSQAGVMSIHGDMAAKRRAIQELLFFASVGDLRRCERITRLWNLQVSDKKCCDYDQRTPLHLAASEGSYKVSEWLLENKADVNALDRFKRTPLEDAVRAEFPEVSKLLMDSGGKVYQEGNFVPLAESALSGALVHIPSNMYDLDPDWEIDPASLQLMEKLGEGEFGIVHKAMWHGTLVAAKILKGSSAIALGDFRSEIEVLRKVHHPNAVQFLGACTKQEPYILVTELMVGGSLFDAFRMTRALTLRRAIEMALDVARGLAYMHAKKAGAIIHRDLKPQNLMISGSMYNSRDDLVFDNGTVKLADFGLSKSLPVNKHASYDLDSKFKLTGETGSYRYMAPEVFRHECYNFKVDVFSFSMIAYSLFEHCQPYQGMDPVEAARQSALYEKRPQLMKLGGKSPNMQALRELVVKCWDPDPEERPGFEAVIGALEALLKKIPRDKGTGGGGGGCCALQ